MEHDAKQSSSMDDFMDYINDLVSIIEIIKVLQEEADKEELISAYKNLTMFPES